MSTTARPAPIATVAVQIRIAIEAHKQRLNALDQRREAARTPAGNVQRRAALRAAAVTHFHLQCGF